MPFVRLAFVQWHSFTPLCSPTMRYPWRSRTSCFSGSISSRNNGGGLKGFRDEGLHQVRAARRRASQAEQLDVTRMERHRAERTALRLNLLESIEFRVGEHDSTVDDPSLSDSLVRQHRPLRRRKRAGRSPTLGLGGL